MKAMPKDLEHIERFYYVNSIKIVYNLGKMSKRGRGVWGMPKILEHFSWTFDHFRPFKSSGRKDGVQNPNT